MANKTRIACVQAKSTTSWTQTIRVVFPEPIFPQQLLKIKKLLFLKQLDSDWQLRVQRIGNDTVQQGFRTYIHTVYFTIEFSDLGKGYGKILIKSIIEDALKKKE
ncbi:MAG: hypothetical protein WC325_11435 [Candidatus Bathyarchaeia archaeon]|jgi:hypothetical protein